MKNDTPTMKIRGRLADHGARPIWGTGAPNGDIHAYAGPGGVVLLHAYEDGGFDVYLPDRHRDIDTCADAVLAALGLMR